MNGQKGALLPPRRCAYNELRLCFWDFGRFRWGRTTHAPLQLLHSPQQLGVRIASGCDASLARGDVFAALAQFGAWFVNRHVVRVAYCVSILCCALQLPGELLVGPPFIVRFLQIFCKARVALDLNLLSGESDSRLIWVRLRQQAFLIVCNLLLLFSSSSCARLASAAKVCGAFACALFLSCLQLRGALPRS